MVITAKRPIMGETTRRRSAVLQVAPGALQLYFQYLTENFPRVLITERFQKTLAKFSTQRKILCYYAGLFQLTESS